MTIQFTEDELNETISNLRFMSQDATARKAADMLEALYDGYKIFILAINEFSDACDKLQEKVLTIGR